MDKAKVGTWSCNFCGRVEKVTNGLCPDCGPTQTTPQDNDAKLLAGIKSPVLE